MQGSGWTQSSRQSKQPPQSEGRRVQGSLSGETEGLAIEGCSRGQHCRWGKLQREAVVLPCPSHPFQAQRSLKTAHWQTQSMKAHSRTRQHGAMPEDESPS